MAKGILKAALGRLLGDYSFYRIFASPTEPAFADTAEASCAVAVDRNALEAARFPEMREQSWYAGTGAHVFAWMQDQDIVAVCAFWHGDRYAERAFWPLESKEAKLVQIVVEAAHRGQGIAPRLIAQSAARMHALGFARLYARVWHSNSPSLRAFEAARWMRIASVVEVRFLGLGPRMRLRLR